VITFPATDNIPEIWFTGEAWTWGLGRILDGDPAIAGVPALLFEAGRSLIASNMVRNDRSIDGMQRWPRRPQCAETWAVPPLGLLADISYDRTVIKPLAGDLVVLYPARREFRRGVWQSTGVSGAPIPRKRRAHG